jgi:methionyl-tRNA synthetase
MSSPKRHLITAALPYVNGPVHIGHLAGVYVPADIYSRFLKLKGKDALFICGSDEHGVPITIRAAKEGITPQQVVDKYHTIVKKSFEDFGIQFDHYSRTSSRTHHQLASDFFLKLYEKGEFIEKLSEQYFDPEAQQFLADRYIMGTCPTCANPDAYGDQCERCGSTLSPSELINPRSALSGSKPIMKETKHWYLPLDKYQAEFLNPWIASKKGTWRPNVYGQCMSWLDQGLQPRAVTRDLDWGIPVPVAGAEGKVLYVWFDAPIGYISATKELFDQRGEAEGWKAYWQSPDSELTHFIGKDNIVFHCIIFPSMLKAHGEYILPQHVPSNEFLNLEGDKISTSRNWAVWLHEYLEDFPGKQDVLRYALTANAPETKDNDFTWKDFQARNNSELVAIYGNFVNRALVLTEKYYENVVPEKGELTDSDRELLASIFDSRKEIEEALSNFKFRDGLSALMNLARNGNKYLAAEEPWKVIKTDPERVKSVMYCALQVVGALAVLSEPFLPFTAAKLRGILPKSDMPWDFGAELLQPGTVISKAVLLFEKIEDEAIQKQLDKLAATKKSNQSPTSPLSPMKDTISYDEFMKMDLRTATVLSAEKVEKSDKLLKLLVDTGLDQRTVVSGIAKHYRPEEMVGKQVMLLANLAPRKIMGIESHGMILMAEDAESATLALMLPEKSTINGSTIS